VRVVCPTEVGAILGGVGGSGLDLGEESGVG